MRRVFVRFLGESSARKKTFWDYLTFNKHISLYDLYILTLAGTNGSIQKGSPRNSPLHSVRAGEDHIHKGENFHPRVVNCVSACTTITDKILTLSFFLLFFQQFWSWSCTASTTTQCLILSDSISFSNFGQQSDIYLICPNDECNWVPPQEKPLTFSYFNLRKSLWSPLTQVKAAFGQLNVSLRWPMNKILLLLYESCKLQADLIDG